MVFKEQRLRKFLGNFSKEEIIDSLIRQLSGSNYRERTLYEIIDGMYAKKAGELIGEMEKIDLVEKPEDYQKWLKLNAKEDKITKDFMNLTK